MNEIKLYQPSNSTAGASFMRDHCDQCVKMPIDPDAKNQCGILFRSMAYSPGDKEYPNQWRYVDGSPTCTAFKSRAEHNAERRGRPTKRTKKVMSNSNNLSLF